MSEQKTTGGPAFPAYTVNPFGVAEVYGGMTLRDYFAAKMMQGYIVGVDAPLYERIAENAYKMADAMLAERAK